MEVWSWLLADYKSATEILSVIFTDIGYAAQIMGLGIHVELPRALCKHKALALLSRRFMAPNEYFTCNTKTVTISRATSERPLILG